jgi:hypothetical protein
MIPNIAIQKPWTSRDQISRDFLSRANWSFVVAAHLSTTKPHLLNANPLPLDLNFHKLDRDKKKRGLDNSRLFFINPPMSTDPSFFGIPIRA